MRIIGGTHRHRRLLGPKGRDTTRPITDRVKQSLFDRLTAAAAFEGACLDLFAGTGSLGLEALSRGMEHCTFVERDRGARQLLEQNLTELGLTDRATVLGLDAFTAAWQAVLPIKPVNLIFCDPPYPITQDEKNATRISTMLERLAAVAEIEGLMLLRTEEHTPAPAADGWQEPVTHGYGSQSLHFYRIKPQD